MRALLVLLVLALPASASGQERTETRELVGQMGSRDALLVLHETQRADGGWNLTGEYIVLPSVTRRFLEGERGPELGVTVLRENRTAISFGRPPEGELRGTWRDGVFRGTRLGPGGQPREQFSFSEAFPSMADYSATVRCSTDDAKYVSSLAYAIKEGKLASDSLEWQSRVASDGHWCRVSASVQQPMEGGLRFTDGSCAVTLRAVGDSVRVVAQGCGAVCASGGYLEPLLVEGSRCRLLRPEPR